MNILDPMTFLKPCSNSRMTRNSTWHPLPPSVEPDLVDDPIQLVLGSHFATIQFHQILCISLESLHYGIFKNVYIKWWRMDWWWKMISSKIVCIYWHLQVWIYRVGVIPCANNAAEDQIWRLPPKSLLVSECCFNGTNCYR